jgi:hypothetical protein
VSDPELVESNPGKRESCPDLPNFPRLIDSDEAAAQTGRHTPAGAAAPTIGLRFRDKLTAPDAVSTTMRQCRTTGVRLGEKAGIRPAA